MYLSAFLGRDNADYVGPNSLNYNIRFGNSTGTLRWNHVLGPKAFANTSFIVNDYLLNVRTVQGGYLDQLISGVRDVGGKTDIDFYPSPKHQVKVGAAYTYHTYAPAGSTTKIPKAGVAGVPNLGPSGINTRYVSEAALYVNDEIEVTPRVGVSVGLRVPLFVGQNATYLRPESHARVRYSLSPETSFKLAYTRMNQFFNELPSSTASFPTDIYIPSSRQVKPQISSQVALDYFRNFQDNAWELSVETYYKTMQNQVNFKEGTLLRPDVRLEDQLAFGSGVSYGLEFLLRRNVGRFTGWASYTLSKTEQTFADLNFGRTFPYRYDRRHNLALEGNYDLN